MGGIVVQLNTYILTVLTSRLPASKVGKVQFTNQTKPRDRRALSSSSLSNINFKRFLCVWVWEPASRWKRQAGSLGWWCDLVIRGRNKRLLDSLSFVTKWVNLHWKSKVQSRKSKVEMAAEIYRLHSMRLIFKHWVDDPYYPPEYGTTPFARR